MADKDFYILDQDRAYAQKRIDEIEKAILDLGPEFHVALNQSNETWHDNAPFDELRERQAVMVAEMQELKAVLHQALPSLPKRQPGKVNIGNVVELEIEATGRRESYLIAGHWTPHAGQITNGHRVISCNTPLATSLLSHKLGDRVTLNPGSRQAYITKIEPAP